MLNPGKLHLKKNIAKHLNSEGRDRIALQCPEVDLQLAKNEISFKFGTDGSPFITISRTINPLSEEI